MPSFVIDLDPVLEEGRNVVFIDRRYDFFFQLIDLGTGFFGNLWSFKEEIRLRAYGMTRSRKIKAGRNDGNDDRFAKRFVDRNTVDDIDIVSGCFFNEVYGNG